MCSAPPAIHEAQYDVLIVGYGPVGQSLAVMLGEYGLRTCVVERWTTLYHLPRAVHYDHETARILQHMRVGEEAAAAAFSEISMEFQNADREVLLRHVSGGLGISGWPVSNMFYQPELEALLDRRVETLPTVERRLGWEVTHVEDGQPVRIRARHLQSHEEVDLAARFVVGCDGANSLLRPIVDTEEADLGFHHRWLVVSGTMRKMELGNVGTQLCDPSRPQTFVPVGPRRIRFEFMLLPGETAESMNKAEVAWALMEPWGFTARDIILERHAVYTFSAKWSRSWRRGNLAIAGDAAHQMPPFLGQGMCSGIRDVMGLAWRLKLVLEGKAAEKILDDYTSERVPHLAEIVTKAVEIGSVLCVTDPERARARDAAMLAQRNEVPIVHVWRLGPGAFRTDDPAAGLLSPQPRLRHGSKVALLDELIAPGFRLITNLPAAQSRLSATNRQFLSDVQGEVVSTADGYGDEDGTVSRWLDEIGAMAVLVRPDFYNFGMARTPAEVDLLVDDLRAALRA